MCQNLNYEHWLAVDKVIAKITRLTLWPTLYMQFGVGVWAGPQG